VNTVARFTIGTDQHNMYIYNLKKIATSDFLDLAINWAQVILNQMFTTYLCANTVARFIIGTDQHNIYIYIYNLKTFATSDFLDLAINWAQVIRNQNVYISM